MSDKILIIGLGSIGQRHARNALALGCEVLGYDTRAITPELRAASAVTFVDSFEASLDCNPLGVIVATPPESHVSIGMALVDAGIPVLIEKPLAHSTKATDLLCEAYELVKLPLAVGYQFRHTAGLRRLKAQVDAGDFGEIYAAQCEFASQQWCSHTYPADLLLECSHDLDLLAWFLGEPITCVARTSADDLFACGLFSFARNDLTGWGPVPHRTANFHLDGLAPGYRRSLTLYGTKGVGEWSLDQAENDQGYVDELAEFLRVCRGEQAAPSCTGRDGWWALRMVEAIRRSGRTGKWEAV